MALRLDPQPWMTDPATRRVVAALAAGGAGMRFVGGCVRDALLGRPIGDIDIATDAEPDRVMALLHEAGLKALPTGLAHGTVTALSCGRSFEITTLRRDVETDGRRARVAFTDDWAADASRRDLTINALSLDPDGRLHDPFGGLEDLRAGRIRFVGDARQRIAEDALRLLRFFRFYAHYGTPPPDADALAACREAAPMLRRLSAERVRMELLKLLAAPDPAAVLRLMREEGVLAVILPEATDFARLEGLQAVEARRGETDPLRRLAALLAADAAAARAVARRLRLSNAERDRLVEMAAPDPAISPALDAAGRRRALYRIGAERFRDRVLLAWAASDAPPDDPRWSDLLAAADAWRPVALPITGADVMALGVPRGPAVGKALRAVEGWWVEGDFRADRAACLARLRAVVDPET